MSDINEYNKHTFLSRVLGNSSSNSGSAANPISQTANRNSPDKANGADHINLNEAPFLDDDDMELQFSNNYAYLDKNNEKIKNMLMSEVSLKNEAKDAMNGSSNDSSGKKATRNPNSRRKFRSNISINFNSESESSDDNSDDDSENAESEPAGDSSFIRHQRKTGPPNAVLAEDPISSDQINTNYQFQTTTNGLSDSAKNQIREELELELELGNDDIPESLLFENTNNPSHVNEDSSANIFSKIEQSLIFQVKEAEKTFGPALNTVGKKARQIAHKTMETSVMQPPPPAFLSNRPTDNSNPTNIGATQRQIFNARRLPPKDRALWMWANVTNLDIFLNDVYDYYMRNGWNCIALSKICDLLIIVFVLWLTSFMGNCIDYKNLLNENVSKLSQVYDGKCYARIPFSQKCFHFILLILLVLRVKNCYKELLDLKEIKLFYNHLLAIDDSELQTISWPQIVKKIMILKNQNTNAIINDSNNNDLKSKLKLNAHDIANRLMRKENYMIAIFNKNILNKALTIPIVNTYFLTKTLEWNLKLCIFDFLFNDQGQLKRKVVSQHHRLSLITDLRKRFRMAGLLSIFLTPFLVIYFILYYFLKLFYDFKTNPGLLNARGYSPYAKWRMREYNELPHLFDQRLNLSIESADDYLNQFPKELSNIILKFISYITGSIVTILAILTIIDHENFLNFELTEGRTVLFYMSTLGALFTICKNSISDNNNRYLFDPEASLKKVSQFTHYLPNAWESRYHTLEVKNQFCDLYNLKLVLIFKELCSLILLPYILYVSLPNSCDKIIDFFRDFSVHVDGIGYVCSFAMFNLEDNKDHSRSTHYTNHDDFVDDNDDKMMKSYMYFVDSYGGNGINRSNRSNGANSLINRNAQTILKKNSKLQNGLLKSAILNNQSSNTGNGGISKNGKMANNDLPIYQEQMEETNAGLFNPNARNYIDDLSNSMILGESFQMGYGRSNMPDGGNASSLNKYGGANAVTGDNDDSNGNSGSGGVLGLLNQVYQHKKRVN
ncbi:hypothetical protein PMKS-000901 [Pichia membranifaciens]|uniref:Autophagy-related protein 9 n=1 Tax=Pichia membranifaciens TaxID=4926 RepID=A0A1Q2YDG5_9ASCO|nr:hypothetical protein PMKS-000901 [Pichia membranifaciens]